MVTADLKVVHHHSLELCPDPENWIHAHMRLAEKWDGRIPGVGKGPGDWKQRARRAEATASSEGMQRVSTTMQRDARIRQLERSQRGPAQRLVAADGAAALDQRRTAQTWTV